MAIVGPGKYSKSRTIDNKLPGRQILGLDFSFPITATHTMDIKTKTHVTHQKEQKERVGAPGKKVYKRLLNANH